MGGPRSRPGTVERSRGPNDSVESSSWPFDRRPEPVSGRQPSDLPWRTAVLDVMPHPPQWRPAQEPEMVKWLPQGWTVRENMPEVVLRPRAVKKVPKGTIAKGPS